MVNSLKKDYEKKINFLEANLKTQHGVNFAKKYDGNKVTLLFFDSEGILINRISGLHDANYLSDLFKKFSED